MQNIKVSVIIPAYNTLRFISRTLDSIELQTYKNYEIVIINDGSTDGTKEFINNYKINKKNVTIYHQDNQGVSIARNKGIELATGDFVCFLDSDDTYDPTFFEEMLKKQEQTGCDVVYCGFCWIKNNEIEKLPKNIGDGNVIKRYYSDGGFVHFSGMIIKKNLLIDCNIKFEPHRKIAEDVLFTIKLFNKNTTATLKKHLFNYILRESSVINSEWNDETWFSDLGGNRKALEYIKEFYSGDDKEEIIRLARLRLLKREIAFLDKKMSHLQFKDINNYTNNSDFVDAYLKNKNYLQKSERRKSQYIISGSNLKLLWGYMYFKYFRINFKK